jgi:hypothetical protein
MCNRRRRSSRIGAILRASSGIVWSFALTACSSDSTGPDPSIPECSGPVTIEVSAGTMPTFDWTPECRLFLVLVELGATDRWIILSEGANAIAPPVRYGVVPDGAVQQEPALPLEAGQTYDVTLARWTGPGGDDAIMIANREFTP